MQINLLNLMDEKACYDLLRQLRWADSVQCPHCSGKVTVKNGLDETHPYRQRYRCQECGKRFDDVTGTVFSGSHQPLKTWIICVYLMGLNLSNAQIAKELEVSEPTAQEMTRLLREGIVKKA